MLNMNKCSSINTDSRFQHQQTNSIPKEKFYDDNDSLTDVSIINQTISKYSNNPIEYKSLSIYDKFISDKNMFQSLIDYANSFKFDEKIYSEYDFKNQLDSINNLSKQKQQQQRIKKIKNINYENLTDDSNRIIPSYFFSTTEIENIDDDNNNNKHNDESTTITNPSKFQWEYLSDTIDNTNLKNSEDFSDEQISSLSINQKNSIINRSTTPIIIREILPKPSSSSSSINRTISKQNLSSSIKYNQSSKPPIIPKKSSEQTKKIIIIEYDQINVKIDKNINQRKEIKRVHPNQYIEKYGSSLCSNEVIQDLLTDIIS